MQSNSRSYVLRSMTDYVKHIRALEAEHVTTLFASSFLASHLFDKATILRYFERDLGSSEPARVVASDLWDRRRAIKNCMRKVTYSELYELEAFQVFCANGIVHRQTPSFRATPKEIEAVLRRMLGLLKECPNYHVAFCREILPFVFIVKAGHSVTIDVRNNFGYQRIQGIIIDKPEIISDFAVEFDRIRNDPETVSRRDKVMEIIEQRIDGI